MEVPSLGTYLDGPTAAGATTWLYRSDLATNRVVGRVKTGDLALGIAIDGASIWIAEAGSFVVRRVDASPLHVADTVTIGTNSWGIAAAHGTCGSCNPPPPIRSSPRAPPARSRESIPDEGRVKHLLAQPFDREPGSFGSLDLLPPSSWPR